MNIGIGKTLVISFNRKPNKVSKYSFPFDTFILIFSAVEVLLVLFSNLMLSKLGASLL
jgi:hypothetical protein